MDWFTSLPDIDELETAEEFLEYFDVPFEADQVRVSRLHIMHQFHTRLQRMNFSVTLPEADRMTLARQLLEESYQQFHHQEVRKHSSLQVYQRQEPCFIPLEQLMEVQP